MSNTKHTIPTAYRSRDGSQYWAHAPYNFVPLPERVVTVIEAEIPGHNVYQYHTGYIECALTTETPVYTRATMNPEFFKEWGEKAFHELPDEKKEERGAFFTLGDPERSVIPGSSLRGMVRSLVEIAGYGKMQWVTGRRLFFRTMDATAVGGYYRRRMMNKVEGGYLFFDGGKFFIKKSHIVRVHRGLLGGKGNLYEGRTPNLIPKWFGKPHQHIRVWVKLSSNQIFVDEIEFEHRNGFSEGRLIITGDIPRKKKEFVFLLPSPNAEEIEVAAEIIERFHDDDQLTQWQQDAFAKDKPKKDNRQRDGMLRKSSIISHEGEPIFFLREDGNLTFIGRAQMFRLPYALSPKELIRPDLCKNNEIDICEAIFGYAPDEERKTGRAGRVYFTDATFESAQDGVWLSEKPFPPFILTEPKPTTFQHYLAQDGEQGHHPDDKRNLAHYGTPSSETTIRGHKLYWHQAGKQKQRDIEEPDRERIKKADKQYTRIRPVKSGVTFRFRVHFDNLRNWELGALLWTLSLPGDENREYRHKLGMGKPLGLGSVKIDPALHLTARDNSESGRYKKLFSDEGWQQATQVEINIDQFVSAFETYVLDRMDETERGRCQSLKEVERIQMLLKLLEWPGPVDELTHYMVIEPDNEYKERPVLPDPLNIAPPSAQGRRRPSPQPPRASVALQPAEPAVPQVGDLVRGKIFEVKADGTVIFEIDGVSPDEVGIGRILLDNLAGKQYREGLRTRCKVIEVRADEQQEGMWIFECAIE